MSVIDRLRQQNRLQPAQQQPAAPAPLAPQQPEMGGPLSGQPQLPSFSDWDLLPRTPIQTQPDMLDPAMLDQLRTAPVDRVNRLREFYANPLIDDELRSKYADNSQAFVNDRSAFYHSMAALEAEKGKVISPQKLYLQNLYDINPSAYKAQMASIVAEDEERRKAKEQADWEARQGWVGSTMKSFYNTVVDPAIGLAMSFVGKPADDVAKATGITDTDVVHQKLADLSTAATFEIAQRYSGSDLLDNIWNKEWGKAWDSAAGLVGSVTASLGLMAVGSRVGGSKGALVSSIGQSYGSIYKDVYEETKNSNSAFMTAMPLSVAIGYMDRLSFGRVSQFAEEASSIGAFRTALRSGLNDMANADITTDAGRQLFARTVARVGEDLGATGYMRQVVYPMVTRMPVSMALESATEGLQSVVENIGKTAFGNILGEDAMLKDEAGNSMNFGDKDYWKMVFASAATEAIGGALGGGMVMMGNIGSQTGRAVMQPYLFKQGTSGLVGETAFYHIARAAANNDVAANRQIDTMLEAVANSGKNAQQIQQLRDNVAYIRSVAPQVFQGVTDAGAMYQLYHNHRAIENLRLARETEAKANPGSDAVTVMDNAINGLEKQNGAIRSANGTVAFNIEDDLMMDVFAMRERGLINNETTTYLEQAWKKGAEKLIQNVNKARHARGRAVEYDQRTIDAINELNRQTGLNVPTDSRENFQDLALNEILSETSNDTVLALATNAEALRNAIGLHTGGMTVNVPLASGKTLTVPVRIAMAVDSFSQNKDGKTVNPLAEKLTKRVMEQADAINRIRQRAYAQAEPTAQPAAAASATAPTAPVTEPTATGPTGRVTAPVMSGEQVTPEKQAAIDKVTAAVANDRTGYSSLTHAFNSVNRALRTAGQKPLGPIDQMTEAEQQNFISMAKERAKKSLSAQENIARRKAQEEEAQRTAPKPKDEPKAEPQTEKKPRAKRTPKEPEPREAKGRVEKAAKAKTERKAAVTPKPKPEAAAKPEPKTTEPKPKKQKRRADKVVAKIKESGKEEVTEITAQTTQEAVDAEAHVIATAVAQPSSTGIDDMPSNDSSATVSRQDGPTADPFGSLDMPEAFMAGSVTYDPEQIALRGTIAEHLSKVFGLDAVQTDELMARYGASVIGRATQAGVEYAANAVAEVIPHEFSHFYWKSLQIGKNPFYQLATRNLATSALAEELRKSPTYSGLSDEDLKLEALATLTGRRFMDIWGDFFAANGLIDSAQALGRAFWRTISTAFKDGSVSLGTSIAVNLAAGRMALGRNIVLNDGTVNSFAKPMLMQGDSITEQQAQTRQVLLNVITDAVVDMSVRFPDHPISYFPHAKAYYSILQLVTSKANYQRPELAGLWKLFGADTAEVQKHDADMRQLFNRITDADSLTERMEMARLLNVQMGRIVEMALMSNHADTDIENLYGAATFINSVLENMRGIPQRNLSFVAEQVGDAGNSATFKAVVTTLFDVNGRLFRPDTVLNTVSQLALASTSPAEFRKSLKAMAKSDGYLHERIAYQLDQRLEFMIESSWGNPSRPNIVNGLYNEFRSTVLERVVTPKLVSTGTSTGYLTIERSNSGADRQQLVNATLSRIKQMADNGDVRQDIRNIISRGKSRIKAGRTAETTAIQMMRDVMNMWFGESVNVKDQRLMTDIMTGLFGRDSATWNDKINDWLNSQANTRRGMKITAVLASQVEKIAQQIFLASELESAYTDHNGQRQQAVTIASWSHGRMQSLFNSPVDGKPSNIETMMDQPFYAGNSMLRLWNDHGDSGRVISKGLQIEGEGIDMNDMTVAGHLFSELLMFNDSISGTYLQNNGELGTREYKEMYMAQRHSVAEAMAMHQQTGPVMAARANRRMDAGEFGVGKLKELNGLSYVQLKVDNGRFVYDHVATVQKINENIDEMADEMSRMAVAKPELMNRLIMTYLLSKDISKAELDPMEQIALEVSRAEHSEKFSRIQARNRNGEINRELAREFVHNYAVNGRMLTDITMGDIYQYPSAGHARKREMNQGSKGQEVGLNSNIHVLRIPDIKWTDANGKTHDLTDSFNFYDHNLNRFIQESGTDLRSGGDNHKASFYHVDGMGNTYNIKSSALGVSLDANGNPTLREYDHVTVDGRQLEAYQAVVRIIEAYRESLPEANRANAKILLATKSSVKTWAGNEPMLGEDVLDHAIKGTLTPGMLENKATKLRPQSFRINFNINKNYSSKELIRKAPVQAVPMLLNMLRNNPARVQKSESLMKALTSLLQFQNELLIEKKLTDVKALSTELIGKAIMNNSSFSTTAVTDHMLEIMDRVEQTGELSIEDETILSAALGKLTDMYNRGTFQPMLNGADLQMMPDLNNELKWGDLPEVIVPAYMGRPGDVIVLMRVPLSAPGSMFHATIKGNSPSNTNTVIVPKEYAAISNSDFDADKLFTFRRPKMEVLNEKNELESALSFYKKQRDDLKKAGVSEDDPAYKRNQAKYNEAMMNEHRALVFDAMLDIMQQPDAIVLRDQPLDTAEFNEILAAQKKTIAVEQMGLPMGAWRSREQTMDGAGAIGVFATAQKTGAMLAQSGVELSNEQAIALSINGNDYRFARFGFAAQHLTGQILQVALDRVTTQLMLPLGINSAVMSEMAMIMQLETADGRAISANDLVSLFTSDEMRVYSEAVAGKSNVLGGGNRLRISDKRQILKNLIEDSTQAGHQETAKRYEMMLKLTDLTAMFNQAKRFVQLDDGIPYGLENMKAIEYDVRGVEEDAANGAEFGLQRLLRNPLMEYRINKTREFESQLGNLSWRMSPELLRQGGDVGTSSGWYDTVSRKILARRYSSAAQERKLLEVLDRSLAAEHLIHSIPDQNDFILRFSKVLHEFANGDGVETGFRDMLQRAEKVAIDRIDPTLYEEFVAKRALGKATAEELEQINRYEAIGQANENASENLFLENLNVHLRHDGTAGVSLHRGLDLADMSVIEDLRSSYADLPQEFQDLLHDYMLLSHSTNGTIWQVIGRQTRMAKYDDTVAMKWEVTDPTAPLMAKNFTASAVLNMFREARPLYRLQNQTPIIRNLSEGREPNAQGLQMTRLSALYPNGDAGLLNALGSAQKLIYTNYKSSEVMQPGAIYTIGEGNDMRWYVVDSVAMQKGGRNADTYNLSLVDITSVLLANEHTVLPIRKGVRDTPKKDLTPTTLTDMLSEMREVAANTRVIGNMMQGQPLVSGDSYANVFLENRELYEDMVAQLTKAFGGRVEVMPWDEYQAAYGQQDGRLGQARVDRARAVSRIVSWSMAGGRLDVVPHEFAHHYVDMFRQTKLVKDGIEAYGSEEAFVDAIGRSYLQAFTDSRKKKSTWARFWSAVAQMFVRPSVAERIAQTMIEGDFLTDLDSASINKHWDLVNGADYGSRPLRDNGHALDPVAASKSLGRTLKVITGRGVSRNDTPNQLRTQLRTAQGLNAINLARPQQVLSARPDKRIPYLGDDANFWAGVPDVGAMYDAWHKVFFQPNVDFIRAHSIKGVNDKLLFNDTIEQLMSGLGDTHGMTAWEQMALLSLIYNPETPDKHLIPNGPNGNPLKPGTYDLTETAQDAVNMARHRYEAYVDMMTTANFLELSRNQIMLSDDMFINGHEAVSSLTSYIRSAAPTLRRWIWSKGGSKLQAGIGWLKNKTMTRTGHLYMLFGGEDNIFYQAVAEGSALANRRASEYLHGLYGSEGVNHYRAQLRALTSKVSEWSVSDARFGKRENLATGVDLRLTDKRTGKPVTLRLSHGEMMSLRRNMMVTDRRGRFLQSDLIRATGISIDGVDYSIDDARAQVADAIAEHEAYLLSVGVSPQEVDRLMERVFVESRWSTDHILKMVNGIGVVRPKGTYWPLQISPPDKVAVVNAEQSWVNNPRFSPVVGVYKIDQHIMVTDAMEVIDRYIDDTAMFIRTAMPVINGHKLLELRENDTDFDPSLPPGQNLEDTLIEVGLATPRENAETSGTHGQYEMLLATLKRLADVGQESGRNRFTMWLARNWTAGVLRGNIFAMMKQYLALIPTNRHIRATSMIRAFAQQRGGMRAIMGQLNAAQVEEWKRKDPLFHAFVSTELNNWPVAKEMMMYSATLADRFSNPMIAWLQQSGQADTRETKQGVGLRSLIASGVELVTGKKPNIGTDIKESMATYTFFDMAITGMVWEAAKIEAVERHGLTPGTKEYWDHVARLTERVVHDSQPANDRMSTSEISQTFMGHLLFPLQNAAQRVTENMMQPIWKAIHHEGRSSKLEALHGISLWLGNLIGSATLLGVLSKAPWEELKEWLAEWLYEEERYPISEDQRYNFVKDDKWDNTETAYDHMARTIIQGLGSGMPILNPLAQVASVAYWKNATGEPIDAERDILPDTPLAVWVKAISSFFKAHRDGAEAGFEYFLRNGGMAAVGGPSFIFREANDVVNGKIKEEGQEQVVTD